MTFENLVKVLDEQRFIEPLRPPYRLEYQGNGHVGTVLIGSEKWQIAGCFSPICTNNCNMVVRPEKRKQELSSTEWDVMVNFMKNIHKSVKKTLEEFPPEHKSYTMRFNSWHGYVNYLVFSMYRTALFSPKSVPFLQYFLEMGYTPQEAFVLMMECADLWRARTNVDRILLRDWYITPGVVGRLVNIRRYKVRGAYTMALFHLQRHVGHGALPDKLLVRVGGFFGERRENAWTLHQDNFTKEALDNVLEYYKEGRKY